MTGDKFMFRYCAKHIDYHEECKIQWDEPSWSAFVAHAFVDKLDLIKDTVERTFVEEYIIKHFDCYSISDVCNEGGEKLNEFIVEATKCYQNVLGMVSCCYREQYPIDTNFSKSPGVVLGHISEAAVIGLDPQWTTINPNGEE